MLNDKHQLFVNTLWPCSPQGLLCHINDAQVTVHEEAIQKLQDLGGT